MKDTEAIGRNEQEKVGVQPEGEVGVEGVIAQRGEEAAGELGEKEVNAGAGGLDVRGDGGWIDGPSGLPGSQVGRDGSGKLDPGVFHVKRGCRPQALGIGRLVADAALHRLHPGDASRASSECPQERFGTLG